MRLPKKWLCEYVDFNVSDEEFLRRMMWRGFEPAGTEKELPNISGVKTGRILSIEQHPNAERLKICQVDVGDKTVQILTNATNVFAGALVPVALVGANIRGTVFSTATLRGVESYGMFCSGKELDITDAEYEGADVDGILILKEDTPIGVDIAEALDMDDTIFLFDLTPNRPDCNGVLGLCREAAAALGQTMRDPVLPQITGEGDVHAYAGVSVLAPELCPRYCGRVMTDIRIEPSPRWLRRRLREMGFRPINNIVDITNYILVEYGQPMHAFDLRCIKDGQIVVRRAADGENITTLDGKGYELDSDMLLIADPEKGVGIAGVMGGLNSEITADTKAVFLESACFVGSNIRHTAKKLHHVTDAAARFIKGVEPVNACLALKRAVQLIMELGAGRVVGELIDVCSADLNDREVDADVAHIDRILNLSLTAKEMAELLRPLHIEAVPIQDGSKLHIRIPHERGDIESGIETDWDIAEEVGRAYGLDRIPPVLMTGETFRGSISDAFRDEDAVKDTLVALGCLEMYNYNFTGPAALDALRLRKDDERRRAVRLMNPFGEDQSLMRTTLYMGMLDSAARNVNRKTGYGRFMEVGNVHIDLGGELPAERKKIGLAFFGEGESFFTLKGAVEELLGAFGIHARFRAGTAPLFQPGRAADIYVGEECIGELGQAHPEVLRAFSLGTVPVYLAELSFDALHRLKQGTPTFRPLPRFPLVARDLAVVVDESVTAQALIDRIYSAPIRPILTDVKLFDVYRGVGVPAGMKSLAFTFNLHAEDHTLVDEEIKEAFDTVIETLKKSGAPLRS